MCNHCKECVKSCPVHALTIEDNHVQWDQNLCVNCDTCIKVCPNLSSPKISWMSVEELLKVINKKKAYIRGITVSGGECMNHAAFLLELFKEVKKLGLTCLIDSNGYYDFQKYPELLAICDGIMLDVKAVDNQFHKQLTGVKNTIVLNNLDYLLKQEKLEEVRTVLLPNHQTQNLTTIDYVSKRIRNHCRYKLIKYRHFGVREEGLFVFGKNSISDNEMKLYQDACIQNGTKTGIII